MNSSDVENDGAVSGESESRAFSPCSTVHFMSDIHGEHEKFEHIVRLGSGLIDRAVNKFLFVGEKDSRRRRDYLLQLIYYPDETLKSYESNSRSFRQLSEDGVDGAPALEIPLAVDEILAHVIFLCRHFNSELVFSVSKTHGSEAEATPRSVDSEATGSASAKLDRKREAIQRFFTDREALAFSRLLSEPDGVEEFCLRDKEVLDLGLISYSLKSILVAACHYLCFITAPKLCLVGDIYDRGPGAEHIVETLIDYPEVDVQWGNHDIIWMGASGGSAVCMATVLRICLRYGNLSTLVKGYGIDLSGLQDFAQRAYFTDECELFQPKYQDGQVDSSYSAREIAMMHKAITIIQFKLEGQVIQRRPEFNMANRLLLDKIDQREGRICIDGSFYILKDYAFPTLNQDAPYALSEEEGALVDQLVNQFLTSEKLHEHVQFLFSQGGMYLVDDAHLLFHACLPVDKQGEFVSMDLENESFSGKALYHRLEVLVRKGYFLGRHFALSSSQESASNEAAYRQNSTEKQQHQSNFLGQDIAWYLWNGPLSPLFGKDKMTTFERYFIAEKSSHKEPKNAYFELRDKPSFIDSILSEFNVPLAEGRIVNGHVPVIRRTGESAIKARGKLVVIDGGFSEEYQDVTEIGGFTLVSDRDGVFLKTHSIHTSKDRYFSVGAHCTRSEDTVEQIEVYDSVEKLSDGGISLGEF